MIREKMQNIQMKRVVILSIPYLIIFYLADKCFWLYRHCMGRSMIEKNLCDADEFSIGICQLVSELLSTRFAGRCDRSTYF